MFGDELAKNTGYKRYKKKLKSKKPGDFSLSGNYRDYY